MWSNPISVRDKYVEELSTYYAIGVGKLESFEVQNNKDDDDCDDNGDDNGDDYDDDDDGKHSLLLESTSHLS